MRDFGSRNSGSSNNGGGSGGSNGPPSSKIYIGNLSSRVSEREIQDTFGKYGSIRKIELKNRYGFVEYADTREATDAVREMQGYAFDQQKVNVELAKGPRPQRNPPSHSDYKLIIDNLSYSVSWQMLKDHMRKAGDVIFADVMKDHNGRSKGYGVVEYKSYDDMRYAIRKLDDTELEGSYIRVREDRGRDRERDYGRRSSRGGSRERGKPYESSRDRRRSPRRSPRRSYDSRRDRSPRGRDSGRRGDRSPRDRSPRTDRSPSPRGRDDRSPRGDDKSPRRDSSNNRRSPTPRDSPRNVSPSPVRRSPENNGSPQHRGVSISPQNDNRSPHSPRDISPERDARSPTPQDRD